MGESELRAQLTDAAAALRNAASTPRSPRQVLTNCIRDHVFTNGAWRDSDLYADLAGEWLAS